jgi:hypothetical protein
VEVALEILAAALGGDLAEYARAPRAAGRRRVGCPFLALSYHFRGRRRISSTIATVSTLTRVTRISRSITFSLWSAKR